MISQKHLITLFLLIWSFLRKIPIYRTNSGDPGGGGGAGGPDPPPPPLSGIYHVLVNKEYVWLATQFNPK